MSGEYGFIWGKKKIEKKDMKNMKEKDLQQWVREIRKGRFGVKRMLSNSHLIRSFSIIFLQAPWLWLSYSIWQRHFHFLTVTKEGEEKRKFLIYISLRSIFKKPFPLLTLSRASFGYFFAIFHLLLENALKYQHNFTRCWCSWQQLFMIFFFFIIR